MHYLFFPSLLTSYCFTLERKEWMSCEEFKRQRKIADTKNKEKMEEVCFLSIIKYKEVVCEENWTE